MINYFIILILLLIQNCIIHDIRATKKLIEKKVVSTREINKVEEEFIKTTEQNKLDNDKLILPVKRTQTQKKVLETTHSCRYLVKKELTGKSYVTGGFLIPFAAEVKEGDFFEDFPPIPFYDWYRMRDDEYIDTEIEEKILLENRPNPKDIDIQIEVNGVSVLFDGKTLHIPLSVLLKNSPGTGSDKFQKYEIQHYLYEEKIKNLNGELLSEKEIPLKNLIQEEEFETILLYETKKTPVVYKDVVFSFMGKANNKKEKMKLLQSILDTGIELNYKTGGDSPLDFACKLRNLIIVKLLVSKKANVNYAGEENDQWSPLFYAISTGDLEIVKYLVENGANVNYTSPGYGSEHYTALKLAEKYPEIKNYLISIGAKK